MREGQPADNGKLYRHVAGKVIKLCMQGVESLEGARRSESMLSPFYGEAQRSRLSFYESVIKYLPNGII